MQQSIESFAGRWKRVRPKLDGAPFHYVSLGVGTGQKDVPILQDLVADHPNLLYMPVDLSAAMLRIGVRESAKNAAIDEDLAVAAAEEYHRSRAFQEFVTSALLMYPDLKINMDSVLYRGSVEDERALLVKVIYQNRTGDDLRFMLPDRTKVTFPDRDTIRLLLSRKYARHGLDAMLAEAGIETVQAVRAGFTSQRMPGAFGTDLLLLSAGARPKPERRVSKADEVEQFNRALHRDDGYLHGVRDLLDDLAAGPFAGPAPD